MGGGLGGMGKKDEGIKKYKLVVKEIMMRITKKIRKKKEIMVR